MYDLIAEYPKQQVTKNRQYTALLRWSSYILTLGIPPEKPEPQWVKEYIIAGKVPTSTAFYVDATINGTAQEQGIQTNIRQHLSAFNDEVTEVAMDAQVDGAMAVNMPRYCNSAVTDAEVNAWYTANGFPPPAP